MRRILIVCVLIFLAGVIFLLKRPPINEELCQIYELFSDHKMNLSVNFIEPRTSDSALIHDHRNQGKRSFSIETGRVETYTYGDEQFERPVFDSFIFDMDNFTPDETTKGGRSLRTCFKSNENKISFSTRDIYELIDIYKSRQVLEVYDVQKWYLSEITFSDDKQHALLFTDMYCGTLCGETAYHLFDKIDKKWAYKGSHILTVS